MFHALKATLISGPTLQLPNFDKHFLVDWDAFGIGFGAVLHQGTRPIAFFSKVVVPHHLKLEAYEWELISFVKAVRHWQPYLCLHGPYGPLQSEVSLGSTSPHNSPTHLGEQAVWI